MVKISNEERIQYYVEYLQILEIFIFALELNLELEGIFKILDSISFILIETPRNIKLARNLGLLNQMTRLDNYQ